jgi:hypothetical protein
MITSSATGHAKPPSSAEDGLDLKDCLFHEAETQSRRVYELVELDFNTISPLPRVHSTDDGQDAPSDDKENDRTAGRAQRQVLEPSRSTCA